MGFSTITAHIILFTVFLTTLFLLYGTFYNSLDEVAFYSVEHGKRLRDQLDSQMTFSSTSYTGTRLLLYVDNTGSATMNVSNMDVYVDRNWSDDSGLNFRILNTTIDPLLWNPGELLLANVSINLAAGLHEAKLVNHNGITVATQFST